jgi:uncharacterized protein
VVDALEERGDTVLLTARDHAQTVELASGIWPAVTVIGGPTPRGRVDKGLAIAGRAAALRGFAARAHVDVTFSHGSYAQILAARLSRIPAVTMMDYEYQPANHLSFRLAQRVIVPEAFPADVLRRFGARERKVVRYPGFKEELYLADFKPDDGVLRELDLDRRAPIVVFRPPPEGALYHQMANDRFGEVLAAALQRYDVQIVLLPRDAEQRTHFQAISPRVRIPERAIDGLSLLWFADLVVGAGGTMNRESALLGTPTYTVFAGRLAAVDQELIRLGRLRDLRDPAAVPAFEKKTLPPDGLAAGSARTLETIVGAISGVAAGGQDFRPEPSQVGRPS